MPELKNCLLYGNGFNRPYSGKPWNELLEEIANKCYVSAATVKQMTIAYEQIYNAAVTSRVNVPVDDEIKKVLDTLEKLESGYEQAYKGLWNLPIKHYLTTNFDHALEITMAGSDWKNSFRTIWANETTRSNKRRHIYDEKEIYHIHGDLNYSDSICLGINHYADNLRSIMNKITDGRDYRNLRPLDSSRAHDTWAEFFFSEDVHIVGYSIADSDFDIWWLLSFRANLINQSKNEIKNRIYYYYAYDTNKDSVFVDCLQAMQVTVLEHKVRNEDDWKGYYNSICDTIRKVMNN